MIGNYGTMAVNINDFARYARSSRKIYGQLLVIPLSFMLMSFMGIIIAGAASDHYGESIWDPLTIMRRWDGSSGARAASAFVSLSFVLAQLGSNISANCVSAANDLNAMFPRVCCSHAHAHRTANACRSTSIFAEARISSHSSAHGLLHPGTSWRLPQLC